MELEGELQGTGGEGYKGLEELGLWELRIVLVGIRDTPLLPQQVLQVVEVELGARQRSQLGLKVLLFLCQ